MLAGVLPIGSRQRTIAVTALAAVVLLVFTQFVLPGSSGGGHRGTPGGVLFFGTVTGLISALTAVGIILIYRTNRIINFAQAAMGAAGSIFAYNLMAALHWPYVIAFPVGVLIGAGIGAVVDMAVIKRFFNAPRLLLTAMTVALLGALFQFALFIVSFPFFQGVDRSFADRLGRQHVNLPFESFKFRIGNTALDYGFPELFAIGMCLLAFGGVAYFLYRTRTGVAVRAAAENTERASLLGIPIKMMSTIVWVIAGALSAIGLLLLGTVSDFTSSGGGGNQTLVRALAAAVLARMKSIPVAVAAAVGIQLADQAVRWSYPDRVELIDLGLLVVVIVGLLLQTRKRQRGEEGDTGTWKTIEEFRPVPRELLQVGGVRAARWILGAVLLGVVLILPWILEIGPTQDAGRIVIYAIVLLSIVVLTGWSGQVSLGQFGLVAIGAVVGGALTARLNIPFWVALPAVSLFVALLAVVLGLSSIRIRGFYLGVTTLAFAIAVQSMLFSDRYFGWLLPDRVDRPTAFFFDFEDERSMYYLCVAGLLFCLLIVTALRRTRTGRVFIGLRENEDNAQSFGINVIRTRLSAFALSGFLAGFAGVLLAHHQRAIDAGSYSSALSVNFFILAVVCGVGSVGGAVIGGIYLGLQTLLGNVSGPFSLLIEVVVGPIGLLFLLYLFPRGLSSVVFGLRDAVLRIVAQRRQLVVPSLFADYDPQAVERQLVPLGAPDLYSGLATLPAEVRYRRESVLYETEIERATTARDEEAKALQAAALRVGEDE